MQYLPQKKNKNMHTCKLLSLTGFGFGNSDNTLLSFLWDKSPFISMVLIVSEFTVSSSSSDPKGSVNSRLVIKIGFLTSGLFSSDFLGGGCCLSLPGDDITFNNKFDHQIRIGRILRLCVRKSINFNCVRYEKETDEQEVWHNCKLILAIRGDYKDTAHSECVHIRKKLWIIFQIPALYIERWFLTSMNTITLIYRDREIRPKRAALQPDAALA